MNTKVFLVLFLSINYCLQAQEVDKQLVYINGGYSPTSNYEVHENDLLTFVKFLGVDKGRSLKVLNAGGENTLVVPIRTDGSFYRDEGGWVELHESKLKGKNYPAANLKNVKEMYGVVAKQKPKDILFVYGDHGGSSGIALWGGGYLTAKDILEYQKDIPAETMVRSIHLHCYGGRGMIDPKRQVPMQFSQLEEFIKQNYLKNRCALSMSREDEIGQYYSWNKSEKDNAWTKIFKQDPQQSLSKLKQHFSNDNFLYPTPVLTSDYLVKDIINSICREQEGSGCETVSFFGENATDSLKDLVATIRTSFCKSPIYKEVSKVSKEIEELTNIYLDHMRLSNLWKRQFIENQYPDFYKKYIAAVHQIEALQAEYALKDTTEEMKEELKKKIRDLAGDYPLRYDKAFFSLDDRSDFKTFFNLLDVKWMKKNQAKYPNIAKWYLTGDNSKASISNFSSQELKIKQQARKTVEGKLQQEQRALAEKLFALPEYKNIKELYDSIKHCEDTIIN